MSDGKDVLIAAVKQALERDPENGPLWTQYADLLAAAGRKADAVEALRTAAGIGGGGPALTRRLVELLRETGQLAEALLRAEKALESEDDPRLRLELARVLAARGDPEGAAEAYGRALAADASLADGDLERLRAEGAGSANTTAAPETGEEGATSAGTGDAEAEEGALASVTPESLDPDEWASQFDWGDLRVTFDEVAGLNDVKSQIRLRIIAPFRNPEIYQAFHRQGGGGILLYGPPGCGKTFIARATAGECRARFVVVGIHDIVDKYWGESEKMIHALFEDARRRAPTVLFFDEFDALGSSRGRSESQFWKTLVDQLLQEMDGMAGGNDGVLIFAATNVPWNIDSAFRRPGRFDRQIFVPPPDGKARAQILRRHVEKLPGGDRIPLDDIARKTSLMTGADLKALCERSSERALERSLATGEVHPVTAADFERDLKKLRSSALEWIATARNYARYANEAGQYDDLEEFLRKVKKW